MGTAARNIVLLGDQMQLGQPIQGVHPGRSGESALEYLLDGQATVATTAASSSATTWRMHEDVCRFISDAVYDGRLHARARQPAAAAGAERLGARGAARRPASGFVAVSTRRLQAEQRAGGARSCRRSSKACCSRTYVDKKGEQRRMTIDEHPRRRALQRAGEPAEVDASARRARRHDRQVPGPGGRGGHRVDDDVERRYLPRNIEFLYNKNRLNVAVSRAKCLAIVVASPELLHIRCNSPEQMELVNTLCWLREYADALDAA